MAAGTMGTRTAPTGNPRPLSAKASATPDAASRPKADPPDRTRASTFCTRRSGASRSVSLVPGAPPMTCTAAVNGCSEVSTVVPDLRVASEALPTRNPSTSVTRLCLPGCRAAGMMLFQSHGPVFAGRPGGGNQDCRACRVTGDSGEGDYTSCGFPPGSAGVSPACYPVAYRSVSLRCSTRPPCRRERHGLGRSRVPAPLPVDLGGADGRGCARTGAGGTPALPGVGSIP